MFVSEILLGLKSTQEDITCAFLHMDFDENEIVYINMPVGLAQYDKNSKSMRLKLKKTLYGLRQSPRAFWKYITVKLKNCKLEQSKFDLYLFIGQDVIIVVYVHHLIFWLKEVPLINHVAIELCKSGLILRRKTMRLVSLGLPWIVMDQLVYLK
jgi:hypothetical protein